MQHLHSESLELISTLMVLHASLYACLHIYERECYLKTFSSTACIYAENNEQTNHFGLSTLHEKNEKKMSTNYVMLLPCVTNVAQERLDKMVDTLQTFSCEMY